MVGVCIVGVLRLSADVGWAAHGLSTHGTTAELHDRRTAFQCLGIWGDPGGNKRRLRHTPFGAWSVPWGGGAGMSAGAIALIIARQPLWTLLSIVLMGYAGNLLLISMQAALSDTHGKQRSIALLEGNVMASIGAFLAPFCVGLLQEAGAGWGSALVLGVCTFLLL